MLNQLARFFVLRDTVWCTLGNFRMFQTTFYLFFSNFRSSSFPSHLMDPTSAYYAALYSQSLYGLGSPYAAAAGMRLPGMPHSAAAAAAAASALAAPPANPAGSSAAANAMDLMALQAMMSRGQTASAGPSSNPYAAGYPASALSGLLGYPGFPPAPPHGGRKDP